MAYDVLFLVKVEVDGMQSDLVLDNHTLNFELSGCSGNVEYTLLHGHQVKLSHLFTCNSEIILSAEVSND